MGNDGKQGVAPCGHIGTHVTTNYVACPYCDPLAIPKEIDFDETECMHNVIRYANDTHWVCAGCSRIFERTKYPPDQYDED